MRPKLNHTLLRLVTRGMDEPRVALSFGPFRFDTSSGELWRGADRIPLQRQPARVLRVLASHPGQIVPRDTLRRELWGDATHVDFAHGLNYCVRQVRLALDDHADSPAYIETLPRVGYRFLAPVTEGPATPMLIPVGETEANSSPSPAGSPARGGADDTPHDESTPARQRFGLVRSILRYVTHASTAAGVIALGTAAWVGMLPLVCQAGSDAGHHEAFMDACRTLVRLATLQGR